MAHPGENFTSAQVNAVPLPKKFPCKECRRDKDPSSFAKKHHRDYRFRKLTNPGYVPTARNTSARCRLCTGEQVHELKCEGQCSLWKPLDKFSKNQRRRGENWCEECVTWKTSIEPNGNICAAPNQDIAPDEDDTIQGGGAGGWNPEEGGDDDYDEDFTPSAPWSQMESLSVADSSSMPPHLRGRETSSTVAAPPSVITSTATPSTGYVPPHLRGIVGVASVAASTTPTPSSIARSTTSLVSNPYADRESTASASQAARHPVLPFTGYDQSGQPHQQYRVASSTTPTVAAPSVLRPAIVQSARSNGNWAKSVGTRNGRQRYVSPTTSAPPPRQVNRGYDSDDSIDEM